MKNIRKQTGLLAMTLCVIIGSASSNTTAKAYSDNENPLKTTTLSAEDFPQQRTLQMTRSKSAPKAVSVKFRRSKYKLKIGQKKRIPVRLRPSIAKEKPLFVSENPLIADFIYGNMLQAKQAGTTYITATIDNGMKARCKIKVRKKSIHSDE